MTSCSAPRHRGLAVLGQRRPDAIRRQLSHAALVLCLLAATQPDALRAQTERVSLFNGQDLSGWKIHGTERWYVEEGELVCESGPDEAYGYLATEATYRDFELTMWSFFSYRAVKLSYLTSDRSASNFRYQGYFPQHPLNLEACFKDSRINHRISFQVCPPRMLLRFRQRTSSCFHDLKYHLFKRVDFVVEQDDLPR